MKEVNKYKKDSYEVLIIGTKSDLKNDISVDKNELEDLA